MEISLKKNKAKQNKKIKANKSQNKTAKKEERTKTERKGIALHLVSLPLTPLYIYASKNMVFVIYACVSNSQKR